MNNIIPYNESKSNEEMKIILRYKSLCIETCDDSRYTGRIGNNSAADFYCVELIDKKLKLHYDDDISRYFSSLLDIMVLSKKLSNKWNDFDDLGIFNEMSNLIRDNYEYMSKLLKIDLKFSVKYMKNNKKFQIFDQLIPHVIYLTIDEEMFELIMENLSQIHNDFLYFATEKRSTHQSIMISIKTLNFLSNKLTNYTSKWCYSKLLQVSQFALNWLCQKQIETDSYSSNLDPLKRDIHVFINTNGVNIILKILKTLFINYSQEMEEMSPQPRVIPIVSNQVYPIDNPKSFHIIILHCYLMSLTMIMQAVKNDNKYNDIESKIVSFICNELLVNHEFMYDISPMNDDIVDGNGDMSLQNTYKHFILKALFLMPSTQIIDRLISLLKYWNPLNICITNRYHTAYADISRVQKIKTLINILNYSSDNCKKIYCSKQCGVMLNKIIKFIESLQIDDESMYNETDVYYHRGYFNNIGVDIHNNNSFQIEKRNSLNAIFDALKCLNKDGMEYLNKYELCKLKFILLRINENYVLFEYKISNNRGVKIINKVRNMLLKFYKIDGKMIINHKYDKKDKHYVERITGVRRRGRGRRRVRRTRFARRRF